MACYNLGDYICESRKQLGITQEELAFGICSTGTLSKIENGFVVPKRKNYEAIMQRLGKTMGICNIHATAEEMELYAYMRQLVHAVANNDMEGSRELWQRQPEHKQEDKLTRQFFSYIKAVLDSKEGVRPELVYAKLEEALHLTHPRGWQIWCRSGCLPLRKSTLSTVWRYRNSGLVKESRHSASGCSYLIIWK